MTTMARIATAMVICAMLAACATAPAPPRPPIPEQLFDDALFAPPSERIDARDVFALNDEMKRYLETEIVTHIRAAGRREALYGALYSKQKLRLDYDSELTRNAAQAFAARAGNCLSLVIMTAAFAKELDIPVQYQLVYLDETWSVTGDIEFFSAHVNLSLGRNFVDKHSGLHESEQMVVDFLPARETRHIHARELSEATVVAMYMNNKAAEALAQDRLDDAYGWARAAIAQDPAFASSYNTLGVVYERHANLARAEAALRYALERNPESLHAMSNLVVVLVAQGKRAEADALSRRLAQLEPNPPFAFFRRGVAAMKNHDFARARAMFAEEVDRAPYYDELRYWLAAAYVGLGDLAHAREQLDLAIEYSSSRSNRDIYAAKLARIKSLQATH